MSSFERIIYNILKNADIPFEQEKTFKDCYNGKYRYDFYLPKHNILLEIQGQQHYIYTKSFHKLKSDFLKGQERDRRKISYALAQKINLYIIPYWEIENIHVVDDILNEKFFARTKFHNDNIWREHQKSIPQ